MECDSSIIVASGMAFEAKVAQGANIHTVYGLNPAKFTRDIEQAIKNGAAGILSFGTAAGLSPSLAPGSVVIGRFVHWKKNALAADETWIKALQEFLPDAVVADIAGVDFPLASAQKKSQLHSDCGAVAADMESHHVAQMAQKYNLPFAVLRVVLDDAGFTLPPVALISTTPEGNVHYGRLLVSLLAYPKQLPALLRLGGDYAKAKESLLRCGHLLKGSRFGFD